MKVRVTRVYRATRSHAAKSCLSILEPAGPRSASPHACLEGLADEILAKNVFRFTDFHGHQPAGPRGWPLRMTSGKVSSLPVVPLLDLDGLSVQSGRHTL